jgi:hypothetical protein
MLNFNAVGVRYEPYPLLVLRPALDEAVYQELVANFPDIGLFGTLPKFEYKLSLSEKYNPANYRRFIAENGPWNRFHGYVKSTAFIDEILEFLRNNHVDLGISRASEGPAERLGRMAGALISGRAPSWTRLKSRFEFSVLKADGGEVAPHTDAAKKIITLVLSMIGDGEWPSEYGGGLDINRATDERYSFNWKNQVVPWDKVEIVDTLPFVPNQCIVFVKTFNSLHSVRRMTQRGSSALRKTVTIVIEKDG